MDEFSVKTTIFSGNEALAILKRYEQHRVAIVTDNFIAHSPLLSQVLHYLGTQVKVFDQVKPDPDIQILQQGTAFFSDFSPEVFIALGGGSALDACKGIRATYALINKGANLPLIAIPTTSGSGSEVTSYAVISDAERNRKYPLVSTDLLADIAILDARLVLSVPKPIAADTGMDVLTHSIEAIVSTNANDFSDALAEKAIKLVATYLPQVYKTPDNLLAREKVHNASCMAGMAFTSSGLGLVHGMAHTLGALFHIPHGKINAMLLPIIIEFNADRNEAIQARYLICAKGMGINTNNPLVGVKELIECIRQLNKSFSMPASLRELGVDLSLLQKDNQATIAAILQDGCTPTNPRAVTAKDIEFLLKRIMG
ncbi:iron-containing alcohol dehydrogenase [Lonepinella koalarum]|nr:iron-containing alcohol dehydrogenase [Lonepinella koalarum]